MLLQMKVVILHLLVQMIFSIDISLLMEDYIKDYTITLPANGLEIGFLLKSVKVLKEKLIIKHHFEQRKSKKAPKDTSVYLSGRSYFFLLPFFKK